MLQELSSASLATLEQRVHAIEARDAVRKVKAAYMQGLDDRLRGSVADLFWEDAIWEGLPDRAPEGEPPVNLGSLIEGRGAIAASFIAAAEWMSFTSHFLTNESITVSGDQAVGTWKLLQTCTAADSRAFWQAGVYTDDFECRDGVWKFSHLRLALDFRTPFDEGWLSNRMWQPS
jgi:ketosteroid isomerase-like protein